MLPAARNEEMEPAGTAAGSLGHGLNQSGRPGCLLRDNENGCRLLSQEVTSEQVADPELFQRYPTL